MDFRDTPEQADFRALASEWLGDALGRLPAADGLDQAGREEVALLWQRELHRGGWACISWPAEYGGRGLGVVDEAIFHEEAARADAPTPANTVGVLLAGPTILAHGTEEQKHRYLPRIASGEEMWCQGFSEPGAGSDLASLATRAVRADGGWRVTGQKVWTSAGHLADKCMLLVRTDPDAPKHRGITYLLADMDDVEVRPLVMVNGDAEFNELFLSDVFVPDDDVLGAVNDGWRVALTTLAFERGAIGLSLQVWARQLLDGLIRQARDLGLATDPAVAERIGGFHEAVEAVRIGSVRSMSVVATGGEPGPEGSVVKLQWARVMQDMTRYGIQMAGPAGVLVDRPGSRFWAQRMLRARGHSVEGGTDEIQKSIIAERVLGLPRSR